ncbi:MAG: tRNA (adenosine(37)-N6)-dimethylallyltransferase MiaA [Bacillota bacterium]
MIVGPTAVGKTEISLEIAANVDGEVISADSMQVYRGMDIGTAKIKKHEMISSNGKAIPHHLIDILDPDENFSVADFQFLVRKLIQEINEKGKIPLLVGGTGLYVNSVIDPYNFPKIERDADLRKRLFKEGEHFGNEHLHRKLLSVDPDTAQRLHPNDLRRIVRALEIYYQTGKTLSSIQQEQNNQLSYTTAMVGLFCERHDLYERINQRVDQMIRDGLIEEVHQLLKKGYSPRLKPMQGLGYRHIAAYLTGILTKEEAICLLKRDTRHFAKRQFTWFKRDQRIKWFNIKDYSKKIICAEKITDYISRTLGNAVE